MCGNIISGRLDPSRSFFTKGGSFWSNNTTDLLASTTEADRKSNTRKYCNQCGYESVALIPIKASVNIFGLIQLNDKNKDIFTENQISYIEMIAKNLGLALLAFQDRIPADPATVNAVRTDTYGILSAIERVGAKRLLSLPEDIVDEAITAQKLYYPFHLISGDYMDFSWDKENGVLKGFLIDVCGHGLQTAFMTASLQVLFQKALASGEPWLKTLPVINKHAMRYSLDGSFVAALCFEFDILQRMPR